MNITDELAGLADNEGEKADVREELSKPWGDFRTTSFWWAEVPNDLAALWPHMSLETRLAVYRMGRWARSAAIRR